MRKRDLNTDFQPNEHRNSSISYSSESDSTKFGLNHFDLSLLINPRRIVDIFQLKAFLVMDKCVVCNENAPFKCAACKAVHYCSTDHQKKDWQKHKVQCRPFKIEHSDVLGRYLVATRDIPAKSVIFIESPQVIGPKWCINADDKNSPYFPCVGCFQPTLINGNQCPK